MNTLKATTLASAVDWSPTNPVTETLSSSVEWSRAYPQTSNPAAPTYRQQQQPSGAVDNRWHGHPREYADALSSAVEWSSRPDAVESRTSVSWDAAAAVAVGRQQVNKSSTGNINLAQESWDRGQNANQAAPGASHSAKPLGSMQPEDVAQMTARRCFGGCHDSLTAHADVFHYLLKVWTDGSAWARTTLCALVSLLNGIRGRRDLGS